MGRALTMYLDYAEMRAERKITMTIKDWGATGSLRFDESDFDRHIQQFLKDSSLES